MPDRRRHRGPQPLDHELFGNRQLPLLRDAVADLSWLLTRGYALSSSLKLVGDRYQIVARQRLAVSRCAASAESQHRRERHAVAAENLSGQELWIDGFNLLTTLEAALSGGVILQGRDGAFRDMASMHGTYRRVLESAPAIELLGQWLSNYKVSRCLWLLDQPVSNSGRLKQLILAIAQRQGWPWQVDLVPDPDRVLSVAPHIVASADSQILNRAERWANLARWVIEALVKDTWIVLIDGKQSSPAPR